MNKNRLLLMAFALMLTGTVLTSCEKDDEPDTEQPGYRISDRAVDPGTPVPGNI